MTAPPPPSGTVARCPHCEAPVEGPEDRFCCHGCETAYHLLQDMGLGEWYARREQPGVRPEPSVHAWEAVPVERDEEGCRATLAIDGIRCTSCTWVVERVLERTEGVREVQVSYATGRAQVRWDPDVIDLEQLASRISTIGYTPRPVDAPPPPDPLFVNLAVALFCTANLMLLTAGLYASWLDGMAPRFLALFRWGALALATPVAIFAAEPFWRGAWAGIREGRIGMDVPVALAVGVLYLHGVVQTLRGAEAYLDSLGMLVTLLLVGRILEARGRSSAADAASIIAARLPRTARVRTATGVEDRAPERLQPGDLLELGPGVEVAADATLTEGALQVQTAMLTGETEPRTLSVGDTLLAGSVVLNGTGAARVVRAGSNTTAMRMAEAVREAIDRPTVENPANALAPAFTAATVAIAAVVGGLWATFHSVHAGVEVAVAVLVVACPCALGLAVPLSVSTGLGALARRGVLLRDGDALLRLAEVEAVALDKTGTLTLGEPTVLRADDEVLRIAAGLERASGHPIARAITREAVRRGLPMPLPEQIREVVGEGVEGRLGGRLYRLRAGRVGEVELFEEDRSLGTIALGDRPREDARRAVGALRALGLDVAILSGDRVEATARMAEEVGISTYLGGLLPEDKVRWIRDRGRVLFVGDGLNDGPAMASAHVSLAMRSGAGSDLGVADGVLAQAGLAPLPRAVVGARATVRAIRANLRRSLVYNALAVTAAAAGWINPLVAAVLMPLSSALVVYGARGVERELRRTD